jgi:hypothetical protein
VPLLDPCRRRLGSSSSGIGCSFRVLGPPKYRPYCFCDPALPLVPYPGYAVFLWRTAAGDCLGYRPHPLIELDVPLESYPASPTRPPQRSGPLMGFGSLQHSRNPRSTSRGIKPSRYVPPSGFGYPLGGLLPRIPCRFCFTPAALMGFTLRRFPLPEDLAVFQLRGTHVPLGSAVFLPPKRQTGLTNLGCWVRALRECLATTRAFRPAITGASHGFCPSRVRCESLEPGSPQASSHELGSLHRLLAASHLPHRVSISLRLTPPDDAPKCRSAGATLLGFLHLPAPEHLSPPCLGYGVHLAPGRTLLPTHRCSLGTCGTLPKLFRIGLGCRASRHLHA